MGLLHPVTVLIFSIRMEGLDAIVRQKKSSNIHVLLCTRVCSSSICLVKPCSHLLENLAGADSTSSLISSFILAMTLHPEILHQAQAEIDRVLEPGRLPNFDDRANLPYLECIIRELYRWNPASPLAVPHKLIQDDEYEGYTIPAGTTIIPNIWCALSYNFKSARSLHSYIHSPS